MTRPTNDYLFAESAAVGRVVDPAGVRAGGYPLNAKLPSNEMNYLMQSPGRWIDYLRYQADGYTTLQDAIDAASPGELVRVLRDVAADYRGRITGTLTGDEIIAADNDGLYLYVVRVNGTTYTVQQILISDWTVEHTFTLTGTPDGSNPVRSISSDGAHCAIAWGGTIEVFELTGYTRVLTVTPTGATAEDVVCFGAYMAYVAKDIGASISIVGAYELATYTSTGVATLTLASTGEVAVSADGLYVYVAYRVSGGTDNTLEVYDPETVTQQTTTTWSNDAVVARALAANQDYVAVGVSATPNEVRVFRTRLDSAGAVVLEAVTVLGGSVNQSVIFTDRYLITAQSGARVRAYALHSWELVWEDRQVTKTVTDITTDGIHIYIPSDNTSQRIAKLHTGDHVTSWLRCDPTSRYRAPYFKLAIPAT